MATGGVLGNGIKVAYSADSPVSWTALGQVLDMTVPQFMADEIDSTVHSVTSNMKRNMPGMVDVSEMTVVLLADLDEVTSPEQHALWNYQQARTTLYWRYEIPVNRAKTRFTGFQFRGWVKSWAPSGPIADKQTLTVTVRFDDDNFIKHAAGASVIS